jgi:hypothetical protein
MPRRVILISERLIMNNQLMEIVLPRLARPLYHQLQRYQSGQMDDDQFTRSFESLLRRQHVWLAKHGVPAARAALAIHGAVLVLSAPGMKAEAEETGEPLEVVEFRAVQEAAADVAANYGVKEHQASRILTGLLARYGD